MDKVLCLIQPFDANQRIIVYKDDIPVWTEYKDINIIPELIPALCYSNEVYRVQLAGTNLDLYLDKFRAEIAQQEKIQYNTSKIIVEDFNYGNND